MKIRDLLTDPSKWCQGAMARDINGFGCLSDDPVAAKWCLAGAANKVGVCLSLDIITWNDAPGRTFAEVRELIEKLDI